MGLGIGLGLGKLITSSGRAVWKVDNSHSMGPVSGKGSILLESRGA